MDDAEKEVKTRPAMDLALFTGIFWLLQAGMHLLNRIHPEYVDGAFQ